MKIAICFSGAIRSFKYCWPSIYKNLVEPLKADIFLHTWKINKIDPKLGVKYKFTKDLCSDAYVIGKLKPIKYVIEKYDFEMESKIIELCGMEGIDFSVIPKKYQKIGMLDKDCYKKYAHNAMGMYYKIMKCNELKSLYESEVGFKYDVVIRARLDFIWEKKINIDDLKGLHDGDLVILKDSYVSKENITNDKFFFGNSTTMDKFCRLFEKIKEFYDNGINIQGSDLFQYYLIKDFSYKMIGDRDYYHKFSNAWNIKSINKSVFIVISHKLEYLLCEYFLRNGYYVYGHIINDKFNEFLWTYPNYMKEPKNKYDIYIFNDLYSLDGINGYVLTHNKNNKEGTILLNCNICTQRRGKRDCNINELAEFIYYYVLSGNEKSIKINGSRFVLPRIDDIVLYNTWEKQSKIRIDIYCKVISGEKDKFLLELDNNYTKYRRKLLEKFHIINNASFKYITIINVMDHFQNGLIPSRIRL